MYSPASSVTSKVTSSPASSVKYLRDARKVVPGTRVEDISIAAGAQDGYAGTTVCITARYGEALLPIADAMRDLAAARLRPSRRLHPVTITTVHVHVDDVLEALTYQKG